MPREKRRNYEVGYGKPPHHTQFKKGQSGNPRGRPCGSKNLKTLVNEVLNELLTITENGRRRKITKREAIVREVINNCSGTPDLRAVKIVFDLLRDIESQTEPASTETAFTAADEEVIKQLKARLLRKNGESDE